jgi:hypothetical protein
VGIDAVCFRFPLTHTSQFCWKSDQRGRTEDWAGYTYHVLLDVPAHLFDQRPSREQDVGEAVFGFGLEDNEVISEGIAFPLFVRGLTEKETSFVYLGNYTATKLNSGSAAWGRLPEVVRFFLLDWAD